MDENQYDVYVYVKFLGQGSFGRVNLYRNARDNSLIVWKEIYLNLLDAKMRNEAFAEVEILAMLDHPNIIGYYKHYIDDDTNQLFIELEYAKAGTLTHIIRKQKELNQHFDQETVLWYLYQLTSAIEYIHDNGIMHRDIKALNIFFMQSGLLKLGDFGIAKILDPKTGLLESQVGTPYYMSPELIEGKKYSTKTDIWALGCVAYEITTLDKVFDATNQLKLALRISQGQVRDIQVDSYTGELKKLIKKILTKNPDDRPSAKDILAEKLINSRAIEFKAKTETLNASSSRYLRHTNSNSNWENSSPTISSFTNDSVDGFTPANTQTNNFQFPIIHSKLSEVYVWGGGKILPKRVEFFKNENTPLTVALGSSHYAVITVEKEIFTWSASQGQGGSSSLHAKLGHGKKFGITRLPKRVEHLSGISIDKVVCGEETTFCVSDQGDLYAFGSNQHGYLGIGVDFQTGDENFENNCAYTPILVPFFQKNNLKVKSIACGDSHVVCLTESNRVFTWGCGEFGRLGTGDEDNRFEPIEIKLSFGYTFKEVFAGQDSSFLLTEKGRILAFGNNENNKLCLNNNPVGFTSSNNSKKCIQDSSHISIIQQLTPKIIKPLLNFNIVKVFPGLNHTAVVDSYGRLFTFGSNKFGQLGVGHTKDRVGLNLVGGVLVGKIVTNAACGDTFTICCTSENQIFSWGDRKDGRLGLDSTFDDINSTVCLPKPIFGSLHLVSDMKARNWNSIIIAEQILKAKPVRSVSYKNYMRKTSSSSYFTESAVKDEEITNNTNIEDEIYGDIYNEVAEPEQHARCLPNESGLLFNNNNNATEGMPDWLKKDFEEADFIPIEALDKKANVKEKDDDDIDIKSIQSLEKAIEIIKILKIENNSLREENKKLLGHLEIV